MKTTTLAAAVLMALSLTAHADLRALDFTDQKADQSEVSKARAKAAAEEAKKKAASEEKPEAKDAAKKDDAKKSDFKRTVYKDFSSKDQITGDLEIGIVGADGSDDQTGYLKFTRSDCHSGTCTKVVPLDKKSLGDINSLKTLAEALGNISDKDEKDLKDDKDKTLTASEERRRNRKKEQEKEAVTESDIREEIASMLSVECGIDEDVVKKSRSNRDSRDIRINQNFEAALGRTRFSGLEMPERASDSNSSDEYKSDAECSANVLKEFMDSHEEVEVGDLKDKLADLKDAELRWKRELRSATSERDIKSLEKKLAAVKEEITRVNDKLTAAKKLASIYDRATAAIAKKLVINPSVTDLATRKFFTAEDFFLHDLAATTPDSFKSVRKAASQSLLDIYRLQSQSYLAFSEMANKTNDPNQKLQYQQAALHYQQAGLNYNAMMSSTRFQGELAHNAVQSGLDGKSILQDIYGIYTPGSQEITSYLSKVGLNGTTQANQNQALPQILMVNSDGTYSPVNVNNNLVGGSNGRAGDRKIQPQTLLNGTGSVNPANSNIQLARPVSQLNSSSNGNGITIQQNQTGAVGVRGVGRP